MGDVNLWIAFWAGLASFISPCCLPLYPSYLSYITGISVKEMKEDHSFSPSRKRTLLHAFFFVLGFSVVFYTLGWAVQLLGSAFIQYQHLVRQLSAIVIIVMGLFLMGIFQPKWLMKDMKLNLRLKPVGYVGSFVIGIGFAAGWSPCIGPILTVIMGLALTNPGTWFGLVTAYSLGFAIPFLLLAFYIGSTKWILKYSSRIMKAGGALMIIMGVLLYTDKMTQITIRLNQMTPDWLKF